MTSPASVSRSPYFLHNDSTLVSVQQQRQHECEEEKYRVHDPKSPGCFQHGAVFVDVDRPTRTTLSSVVSERSEVDIDGAGLKIGTVDVIDATQIVDRGDECADKAQVYKSDKDGRAPC